MAARAFAALSGARHLVSALTWDNPLAWPRFHGRHPLADLEGPEYRLLAPFRDIDLAGPEERAQGTPLELAGRVYDRATGHPVGDAVLDIWQASPRTGRYSGIDYALRGRFRVGPRGRYIVRTVLPPPFEMHALGALDRALLGLPHRLVSAFAREPVRFERPPHIHVIVRALGYHPLTTQLYPTVEGEHPWRDVADAIRQRSAALAITPHHAPDNAGFVASFDFVLDRRAGALHGAAPRADS